MIAPLQALRFIFVLLIFMSHFSYGDVINFDYGGNCGVSFFFILSGFVMTMAYGEKIGREDFSYKQFMLRRLWKIYPLHLLCILAFIVIRHFEVDYLRLLPQLLLVHSWLPSEGYYFYGNPVAWFLADVVFFYAMFPFLAKHIKKMSWRTLWMCIVDVVLIYAAFLYAVPDEKVNALVYVFPPVRLIDFALGIITYRIYKQLQGRFKTSVAQRVIIELAIVACFVALAIKSPHISEKLNNACIFWVPVSATILYFALLHPEKPAIRFLSQRWMAWLGTLAHPFFMIHVLVLGVVFGYSTLSVGTTLLISLLLTLLLSWMLLPLTKMQMKVPTTK